MACSHCGNCCCGHGHESGHECSCGKKHVHLTVSEALQQRRPWVLASLAKACGITEFQAAADLPADMRVILPGADFEEVWEGISRWEKASVVFNHFGHLVQFKCKVGAGTSSRGYYHLSGESGFSGHIKKDDISHICYLSLPFMGREMHSIQFFNEEGRAVFSIFPGRDEREVIPSVLSSFMRMRRDAELKAA